MEAVDGAWSLTAPGSQDDTEMPRNRDPLSVHPAAKAPESRGSIGRTRVDCWWPNDGLNGW